METILKRDDGTQLKINTDAVLNFNGSAFYSMTLEIRKLRAKKWHPVSCRDDYSYRRLDNPARKEYEMRFFQRYLSPAEIYMAMMATWELMRPDFVPDLRDSEPDNS